MIKVLKILGIIVLVIVIGIIILFIIASKMSSIPKNYWEKIESWAEIENKYNRLGNYETEKKVYDAPKDERDKNDNHYVVWYPKEKGTYPLIVMVNGTGVPYNKYEDVFKHFASWGYVVIGNDYGTNWDGLHASESLDFALNTKEIADMIDKNKIAIGGHSQGGMGTFNAINEYDNGKYYKVLFSLSPTNRDLGIELKWGFDLDSNNAYAYKLDTIQIPTLLVAGTGPFDNDTVSPLAEMEKAYNELNVDKVMMRRSDNIDHGAILYEANGYVLAFLDYYLNGVEENEKAFFGNDAEIYNNERYQNVKSLKLKK